jgi:hypothetical protein
MVAFVIMESTIVSAPIERRRPPKLDLAGTKTLDPPHRTPKDIVNDIAIQCVSPGVPPFMRDTVLRSKSIEAQQRRIIAQRAAGSCSHSGSNQSYSIDRTNDTDSFRSEACSTPLTSVEDEQSDGVSQTPRSLRHMNRAPRPADIHIYPPGVGSLRTIPLSAPAFHHCSSPHYSGWPRSRATVSESDSSIVINSGRFSGPRTAMPVSQRMELDDDEDDDPTRDPEDAALSDNEADRPIEPSRKRTRTMSEESENQKPRQTDKRTRFLKLCMEMWDLLHEDGL